MPGWADRKKFLEYGQKAVGNGAHDAPRNNVAETPGPEGQDSGAREGRSRLPACQRPANRARLVVHLVLQETGKDRPSVAQRSKVRRSGPWSLGLSQPEWQPIPTTHDGRLLCLQLAKEQPDQGRPPASAGRRAGGAAPCRPFQVPRPELGYPARRFLLEGFFFQKRKSAAKLQSLQGWESRAPTG